MFGRNRGAKTTVVEAAGTVTEAVADAADAVVGYVDPVARDEKLRQRLAAAVLAGAAARRQIRTQTGLSGLLRRLAADRALRAQLIELGTQLQAAQKRAKKARSHKLRNGVLFVSGVGMVVASVPAARGMLVSLVRGRRDISLPGSRGGSGMPEQTAIEEEVEVAVPVSTAYNQWTQFEEFPRFMEGVDEVRQLDDTLLHWAATVAGKHAEWDAKIIEQEPDRRITWVSTDGKHTRGTVSFEEAGIGRSRIRLHMTYTPEGVTEKVGSAVGLDRRRIRGDLERFRELLESQQAETGAWRGQIDGGVETSTAPTT
ncbi:MAG: SRPBCC family protein [Gaiellaceae bacterium]